MNRKTLFFAIPALFVALVAYGATIGEDTLRLGKPGSSADKVIDFDGTRIIRANQTSGKIEFANDGASFKEIGSGSGGSAGVNILENADFESGTPPSNWSASGGTFIAETGAPGFGAQSGSWDASAASQTLSSTLQSVPLGLESRSCNATIQYKYASGSAGDYKLQVLGSTAGLIAEKDLDVSADWRKDALQFTCPDSDSIQIVLESQVDGGILLVDNATLGKTDFVDVSQAELMAHAVYPATANCTWSLNSATFTDFGADSDCPAIDFQTGAGDVDVADNDLPDIVFDTLPPGRYVVTATANIGQDTNEVATKAIALWDGSNLGASCSFSNSDSANGSASVAVTCQLSATYTAAGARTFSLRGKENGAGALQLFNASDFNTTSFTVEKYPLSSNEAITLETSGYYVDATIGTANATLNSAVGALTDLVVSNAAWTLTNFGQEPALVPCSAGNPGTGTTCSAGDEVNGIVFDIEQAGQYKICTDISVTTNVAGTSGQQLNYFFYTRETSLTGASEIQRGKSLSYFTENYVGAANANVNTSSRLNCSIYNFNSVGQKRVELAYNTNHTSTSASATLQAGDISGAGAVHWTVEKLTEQKPTPVFTDLQDSLNNKTSSGTIIDGSAKLYGVFVTNTGAACTFSELAGAYVTSVTRLGNGQCSIAWNGGVWSVNYVCLASPVGAGVSEARVVVQNPTNFRVDTFNSAGTPTDGTFYALCFGTNN